MVGVLIALAIGALALLWAKWAPYLAKAVTLSSSHKWSGTDILAAGGVHPGDAPSWHAATSFAGIYGLAIWKALVAAVLISAAIQALVPRIWLRRLLGRRRPAGAAAVGGLMSTASMMCTCCAAPVASTLRRDGVPTAAAVAYWLGNPLLNPAVVVFLAFVAPWQWTVTRLGIGVLLVVVGSAVVARIADRGPSADAAALMTVDLETDLETSADRDWWTQSPGRFARALLRLVLTVLPEYLVMVLLIGAFRGWLFPLASNALHSGLLVVLVAAVVGTLVVIPTAGEIPIIQGLAVAGLSMGAVGALLVTLPAVSVPAMSMVLRAFGWRATIATAGVVAVGGVAAGALLTLL